MVHDVLTELGLYVEQVSHLSANDRSRLLNFLLRWDHIETLHACLDSLIPTNPGLVSLLDLRVRAFLAQDRPDRALPVMEERLQWRTSLTARSLLAQVHLALGQVETAHSIALALVQEHQDSMIALGLLGEVELARNDTAGALSAYRRLYELNPNSRSYVHGMIAIYRAQDDWVSASGYAVRLLSAGSGERPLSVTHLRWLRDYFRASGETPRAIELAAEIEHRRIAELDELKATLGGVDTKRQAARSEPRPRAGSPHLTREAEPDPSILTFDHIPVSAEERTRIAKAARRLFGFDSLLPGQVETLACVLRGEDVLTILPTGGGKSLCYQLPALMAEQGTTLVISPLIALMKDQLDSLPGALRSQATTINSSLEWEELQRQLERASRGAYRLVYAAPERLRQPPFLHALRRAGISRLVVDEAHCVSAWGHDFRPDYLVIGQARRALGNPPLLAMTATAPPRVRRDIARHLGNPESASFHRAQGGATQDIRIVAGDVTRLNLQLEVFHARSADDKLRYLVAFCEAEQGNGIVYAGTRARCEELSALLRRHGVDAETYHAGIADRATTQDNFMSGHTRVVVATVAFGLGIDKPDIRFIVHFVPPPSLEAYYQEAGRAGRDGLPARCLLMFAPSDRATLTRHVRQDAMPIEFLRATYAAVRTRLGGASSGLLAAEDLERDLRSDGTRIRVALSLLEEAGLLRRGPDLPRAAVVCLRVAQAPDSEPSLAAFCRAARLRPRQPLEVDLAETARQAGLPVADIEGCVLDWAESGWLDYRPVGRGLLLEFLPLPADVAERMVALLERYSAIQGQRVDEIAAFVHTRRCRHGHINAYLGGRVIEACQACDNCIEIGSPPDTDLPDEREQWLTVLRCVADSPWSWGKGTLVRILRGDGGARVGSKDLRPQARTNASFGALAFRSAGAVERMLDRMENEGLLHARRLEHGGIVLDLTSAGRAVLQDPSGLEQRIGRKAELEPEPHDPSADGEPLEVDETLFQTLREWRLERARAQKVPPYAVLHDSHLRAIAVQKPVTLESLAKLPGIGPKRLERYGDELIALVRKAQKGR